MYINHLTRSLSCTAFSSSCFLQRRFYAEKKKSLVNHYHVLGVNPSASVKEIKMAFYRLSKKYHPDVNPDDRNAATQFTTISDAYDILNDPMKRRAYDSELLFRNPIPDPHVTYNRNSEYAQRARAYRASAWKSSSASDGFNRGFPEDESTFENNRSTSHGSFDQEQYNAAFGRYRDYCRDFNNGNQTNKETEEEDHYEEQEKDEKAARTVMSKLILFSLCLSFGLTAFFTSNLLLAMHFQQPTEEHPSRRIIVSKSSRQLSSKF